MTNDFFPEITPVRPIWLITLADLALLLVGFFVFVQANQQLDRRALAKGLREGFGGASAPASLPTEAMPVAVAPPIGFAPGSSDAPAIPAATLAWARDAVRDPRIMLKITGIVDGSAADVDPASGSGALLAADRARAVAMAFVQSGTVPGDRLTIAGAARPMPGRRMATITQGFGGDRP